MCGRKPWLVFWFNAKVIIMKNVLKNFVADQSGASAAEYALILAVVGAGIAVAAAALGTAISGRINTATQTINGTTTA
jgi:pilus assembly protein Flp/PilA